MKSDNKGIFPTQRRVLVIDHHPIVRAGVRRLLAVTDDLCVCGEASSFAEALTVLETARADVAIAEVSQDGGFALEAFRTFKGRCGPIPVLVLSAKDESVFAERLLSAGARGFIMKSKTGGQVVAALRHVLNGEIYVSKQLRSDLFRSYLDGGAPTCHDRLNQLSIRELQVYELTGKGHAPRQIAVELGLSSKTVESHGQRIRKKLGLKSTTDVIRHAVQSSESDCET